ncbi:hypothetical protein XI02_30210 [Bradyrhizobium sp. CCBAU 21365]|nr:hypothetical protein XI02_30210 [Bradyrhizobium sp. CCBAU 21365]
MIDVAQIRAEGDGAAMMSASNLIHQLKWGPTNVPCRTVAPKKGGDDASLFARYSGGRDRFNEQASMLTPSPRIELS